MGEFDYLSYLKEVFDLQDRHVEWAIIEETRKRKEKIDRDMPDILADYLDGYRIKEESTLKPGLYIKDSRVYVDLLARRLFSTINLPELSRKVYPARRNSIQGEGIMFEAKEDTSKRILLSSTFIEDIYNVTRYGEWMEERLLL